MKKTLGAVIETVEAFCRAGVLVAFSILIGVVTLQVLGRLPGVPSPAWTEEVARFCLVWLVACACGVAIRRNDLVNVDLFVTPLPPKARAGVERVVDVIVILFCLAIIPGAWRYVTGSFGERARSVDLPMIWIYAVTLVIPASLIFFSLARILGFAAPKHADHGETA